MKQILLHTFGSYKKYHKSFFPPKNNKSCKFHFWWAYSPNNVSRQTYTLKGEIDIRPQCYWLVPTRNKITHIHSVYKGQYIHDFFVLKIYLLIER